MLRHFQEFEVLRQMANLTKDGVLVYDLVQQQLAFANTPAADLFGITDVLAATPSHALGKISPDDVLYVKRRVREVPGESKFSEFEFRVVTGQDTSYICCRLHSVMDDNYLLITLRDITKTKSGEEYLVEFGSKKNTLLESLAHNLSGALGVAQQLTSEAIKPMELASPGRTIKFLELLNENTRFCIDLINALLADEHEKSPQILPKSARFNVMEKIRYVLEELSNSYPSKKFIVEDHCVECIASSDEIKMLQVLINLVSNAIKFTREKGVIKILLHDDEGFIRITVEDNGIGIPLTLQPFVFDKNGVAGRTGLKGEKSRGLGLSINKQLVALLGGKLWMESVEGVGSSFYFTITK